MAGTASVGMRIYHESVFENLRFEEKVAHFQQRPVDDQSDRVRGVIELNRLKAPFANDRIYTYFVPEEMSLAPVSTYDTSTMTKEEVEYIAHRGGPWN